MRALVTGAAGFIGSHLCERLINDGHTVIGMDDLSNGKIDNLAAIKNNPSFHLILGDVVTGEIADTSGLTPKSFGQTDWFFHLAAKADIVPSIEKPMDYHKVNVLGTLKMLEAARNMHVKKFVYAASSSCYGLAEIIPTPEQAPCTPMYPYALTKFVGECYAMHWCQVYKLPVVSLRLFNVFGPRHRTSGAYGAVFGTWLAQMANNKTVTIVGDGEQKRDFTYVTDVADAFVKAAESPHFGSVYNVGSGSCYSVNYLADLLGAKDRTQVKKRHGEPDSTYADTRKIYQDLRWTPRVSFEEGVEKMKAIIPDYKSSPLWTPEKIEKATESWHRFLG